MKRAIKTAFSFFLFFTVITHREAGPCFNSGSVCVQPAGMACAGEIPEGQRNFLVLKELYNKWQSGLFGSGNSYKRKLRSHLAGMIGRQMETDRSFIIESPGSLADKKVICKFIECRWLKLHGVLDVSELKSLVEKDKTLVKKWWRSGMLFSVSGRVRKFRIGRDRYGDTVELYLDVIKVHRQ